ncbi:MAG: hypothetical protein IK017_10280 [Paludibacteraceae bacterium]|nr:hypothetical protein [Paludibacteraceae bacterium]MBO7635936.1 hypothetical protein [Paludibacteraceae bacterium]MBR5973021.1 hypothetical protein [Paludibacteraceae bacterium]
MKRLIFGLLCVFSALSVNAQDYKFKVDKDGNCEITDTMTINVTKSDCYRIVKEWLYTISCVSLSFSNEKKDESMTFNNVFYTQKRYNSFSGTYSDNLSIDCDVTIENGRLIYHVYNITLIKAYSGYGASTLKYPVAERIYKINMAKKEISRLSADKSISKSDRRAAIEEQEAILDDAEVLAKCYDVLMERFSNLQKMVQWTNQDRDEDNEEVPFP